MWDLKHYCDSKQRVADLINDNTIHILYSASFIIPHIYICVNHSGMTPTEASEELPASLY